MGVFLEAKIRSVREFQEVQDEWLSNPINRPMECGIQNCHIVRRKKVWIQHSLKAWLDVTIFNVHKT